MAAPTPNSTKHADTACLSHPFHSDTYLPCVSLMYAKISNIFSPFLLSLAMFKTIRDVFLGRVVLSPLVLDGYKTKTSRIQE